jgi:hypothetical protein
MDDALFNELAIGEIFRFSHQEDDGPFQKTGDREYILATPQPKRIGSRTAPIIRVVQTSGGEAVADQSKTPTLRIKSDSASLLTGFVELAGQRIMILGGTLTMNAGEETRATLDVGVFDGLDIELPAAVTVNLQVYEPGTLDVNGSNRGLEAPIAVTPGDVPRRWTFRRMVGDGQSVRVVSAILGKLSGRGGFAHWLDSIDDDTREMMEAELARAVTDAIRGEA